MRRPFAHSRPNEADRHRPDRARRAPAPAARASFVRAWFARAAFARAALAAATVAAALGLAAGGAAAMPVATVTAEHVGADVLIRNAATAPGEEVAVALRHTLTPGWHTYWENPGDSGEAPIVTLTLPGGDAPAALRYPTPTRVPYPPLMNYGYSDGFTLLTSVAVPPDWPAGTPYPVTLKADWLVCADICIPEGGTARFEIPTGTATEPDSGVAFAFMQAEWALPDESDVAATYVRGTDGALTLDVPGASAEGAYFYAIDRDATAHTEAQPATPSADRLRLTVPAGRGRLDGTLEGVLATADGATRIVATGPPDPPVAAAPATPAVTSAEVAAPLPVPSFWTAVGLAMLGGLILNLMPCVFPVLALKVLGLVAHADAPLRRRAAVGAAYTAGVLAAFGAVAGALFAVKAGGTDVLWGFQLQSPGFVAAMAGLLFLVGLNLSGVFEVGVGGTGRWDRGDGARGAFAAGALATLVATPCTAPFMAVALGAALVAPPTTAVAVFAALGLGLALPFALLSVVPGLARILPRPGVWMLRLRQALAFPLYLTAAWLVHVLAQLVGIEALMPALAALVVLALAAWLYGLSQRGGARSHRVAGALAAVSLGLAVAAMWPVAANRPTMTARAAGPDIYTPERLAMLTAAGQPVFVNVTAAWCITCKVNERVVLSTKSFADLLERHDAAYLEADWTRRDPDVTRLIERFGRAGVPLYVLFNAAGDPVVLPQMLSEDAVARALAS